MLGRLISDTLTFNPYLADSLFSLNIMSENILPTGARARRVINMNEPDDINYWVKKFGITREQLRTAVDAVGGKETKVLDYLRWKGIVRF